ncbi:hypothetical protein ACVW17_003359 [Bradyrhizobium sp. USDA 4473]
MTVLRAYHDPGQSTAAKRRRLNDLEDVVVHRQPGADASSGGNSQAAPVASAGVIIRGSSDDTRPLYPEDAADILRLKEALIEGRSMTASNAKKHANSLISFSRWPFEKNKPSIIARLDGKSLTDGCDVHEFSAGSDANRLVRALEHLRTFRSPGGVAPIVRPGRDDAAAQHSTSHGASTRPEEPRDWRNDQPAPSAFIEERAASGSDQLRYGELRRMVDSLDDPAAQSPVSLVSEGLRRLEKQVAECVRNFTAIGDQTRIGEKMLHSSMRKSRRGCCLCQPRAPVPLSIGGTHMLADCLGGLELPFDRRANGSCLVVNPHFESLFLMPLSRPDITYRHCRPRLACFDLRQEMMAT